MRHWIVKIVVLALGFSCLAPASASAEPEVDKPKFNKLDVPFEQPSGSVPVVQPDPLKLPRTPLRTQGRWVVDAKGKRVKLASANWYGAESPEFVVGGLHEASLRSIARWIRERGFNSIRLPWSNELLEKNPPVKDEHLAANPELRGLRGMEIFDRVVEAVAAEGLMVVLDNHRSKGEWCCDEAHGDGLWYSKQYPESAWLADWKTMANRYRNQPAVVAAELRNEIRPDPAITSKKPSWGDGDKTTDWKRAAELGGEAVLAGNPDLLVIIGGTEYQGTLEPAYDDPAKLSKPGRLMYAAHDYHWFHPESDLTSYQDFKRTVTTKWGKILAPNHPATAPVYVSEFGTCGSGECSVKDLNYIRYAVKYLKEIDADWAYWPLNGTQSEGYSRPQGEVEHWGAMDADWRGSSKLVVMGLLITIQRPQRGPDR